MLKRQLPLLVLSGSLAGCGGPELDARAEDTIGRLEGSERRAPAVLVELDAARRGGAMIVRATFTTLRDDGSKPVGDDSFRLLDERSGRRVEFQR